MDIPDRAIELIGTIKPEAFTLFCYMSSIAIDGRTTVDYETMRKALRVSKSTIRQAIDNLVAAGLITKVPRFKKSYEYQLITSDSTTVVLAAPLTTTVNLLSSSSNRKTASTTVVLQDDYQEAFYVFAQVTGLMAFNSISKDQDVERIGAIVKAHGVQGAIDYLKPFFDAWCKRRSPKTGMVYNRTTTGWLDWAIGGEIPGEPGSNGKGAQSEIERLKAEGWEFPDYEHV